MGKVKNIVTDIQEQNLEDQIDPSEWDAAFPENATDDYMNYLTREYESYLEQKSKFYQ